MNTDDDSFCGALNADDMKYAGAIVNCSSTAMDNST